MKKNTAENDHICPSPPSCPDFFQQVASPPLPVSWRTPSVLSAVLPPHTSDLTTHIIRRDGWLAAFESIQIEQVACFCICGCKQTQIHIFSFYTTFKLGQVFVYINTSAQKNYILESGSLEVQSLQRDREKCGEKKCACG